jgi:hypothetical protein
VIFFNYHGAADTQPLYALLLFVSGVAMLSSRTSQVRDGLQAYEGM